jgi:hypothetical protein
MSQQELRARAPRARTSSRTYCPSLGALTFVVLAMSGTLAAAQERPRVAVLPRVENVDVERASAWATTLAAALADATPDRDVRAMPPVAASECDASCVGARLGEVSAQVGVQLDLRGPSEPPRRGSPPASPTITAQLVAPISGQLLGAPIAGTLLPTGALSLDVTALVAALPPPPAPPPTVLVAVDVDGATVTLDDAPLGQAPLAPFEVHEGTHELRVSAPGHETFTRRLEVPADGLRVDVRLVPVADEAARLADADAATQFETAEASDPLWKKWWLWAAVGGAVALAVIVGVAVAVAGGDDPQGFPVPPIPGRMP